MATRPLTGFIDDFSVWYLRRSRDRFKEEGEDKKNALATIRFVLNSLSRTMAPAMPFFAEYIFQETKETKQTESVHLDVWPKFEKKMINKVLEEKMDEARNVVNLALAERVAKGLKVKQPLASIKVKNQKLKIKGDKNLLELIKDEVNVKEVIFDEKIAGEVELDLNLTEELKQEGMMRELIRHLQAMRKELGLTPADKIYISITGQSPLVTIFEQNKDFILREARGEEINISEKVGNLELEKNVMIGEEPIILAIRRA